jgi:hypothetical protein
MTSPTTPSQRAGRPRSAWAEPCLSPILLSAVVRRSAAARANMRDLIAAPSDKVWAFLRVAVMDRTEAELADGSDPRCRRDGHAAGQLGARHARGAGCQRQLRHPPRMADLTSLYRDATAADFFEILALCLNDPTYTKRASRIARC